MEHARFATYNEQKTKLLTKGKKSHKKKKQQKTTCVITLLDVCFQYKALYHAWLRRGAINYSNKKEENHSQN